MCRPGSTRLPLSVLNLAAVLEGRRPWQILDGNLGPIAAAALAALAERPHALVGVTVMPGPQVAPAIEISAAIRAALPVGSHRLGRLFPDAVSGLRHQRALRRLPGPRTGRGDAAGSARAPARRRARPRRTDSARDPSAIRDVAGLTWKRDGARRPQPRAPRSVEPGRRCRRSPTSGWATCGGYLRPSFMGAAHGRAPGGARLPLQVRVLRRGRRCGTATRCSTRRRGSTRARRTLRDRWGADGVQFYDHNFFDREESSVPVLEVLARLGLPWWCYARADTLARFAPRRGSSSARSRLRMAYIGAEAASDDVLQQHAQGIARRPHARGGRAAAASTA